ncbi:MAG: N5-carboxyaminoimidazole ribonucleotide mutase [Verrucomicrobia subdivision 3 bacterium]|nr:N5-carboxyaminoimidazole ribonucleotide mutase [Limisphaerales bacterium]MCS1416251.1 N5-carboxyaminoimidazole ribonucleotide mutase [Limisphaerales bacterium]
MFSHHSKNPLIGIIMGSDSDWPTMKAAAIICQEFNLPFEARVVSAHRTPLDMADYASESHERGLKVLIAGAGGAAHLPGMVASHTPLPVIGVPIESRALKGIDSLLSIVQMPSGVPVATVGIGNAKNAGLLAVAILGASDETHRQALLQYKQQLAETSRQKTSRLQ